MRKLLYVSIFVLFSLLSYTVAYAQSNVYLPITANNGAPKSVGEGPNEGTIPANVQHSELPDYTSLSMDVNANVTKEVTAINFVNNAPNATTTITDVHPVDFEMGDLVGTNGDGKVYAYTHVLKTKTDYCVVFKAYRDNGDHFLTVSVLACYDAIDTLLDPNDQYHRAYMVLNQLMELYAK